MSPSQASQCDATDAIEEWGRNAKPSSKGSNDYVDCYKKGYELVGRTRLATLWHSIGHKVPMSVIAHLRLLMSVSAA